MSTTLSRVMEISTPLNPHLLFFGMHARQELRRPTEYEVSLPGPRADLGLNELSPNG